MIIYHLFILLVLVPDEGETQSIPSAEYRIKHKQIVTAITTLVNIPLKVNKLKLSSNLGVQFAGWLSYHIGIAQKSKKQSLWTCWLLLSTDPRVRKKRKEEKSLENINLRMTDSWESGFLSPSFHFRINKI